jgi:hypothetical protein
MTNVKLTREEIEAEALKFIQYHNRNAYTTESKAVHLADLIERLIRKSSERITK